MVFGGVRPTGDIDFGIAADAGHLPAIEAAIENAARVVGVAVQYSTDIDRWSSIAIPPGHFRTRPWRRVGRLSVHLLQPACWAVYKLARYLDSDADDLVAVLGRERVAPARLARLCGDCLRTSPRSTQLFAFRRHVEHFFRSHGPRIWGTTFRAARTIEAFHRAAGIVSAR